VLAVGGELVDEAEVLRLLRRELLALEEHLHQRLLDAEEAHDARHAAAAREETELHLGQAELDLRIVDRDAVVRGERDLEAAAERVAVDARDDGLAERLEHAELALDLGDAGLELLGLLGADLVEVVEVAAGE